MLGSSILEVAIGLAFVYLLLSLVCSAVQEGLESWLKCRASDLEKGISGLLGNADLVADFYQHPLIFGLFQGDYRPGRNWGTTNLPTYVPASSFSTVLLDLVARGRATGEGMQAGSAAPITVDGVRAALEMNTTIPAGVRRVLGLALDSSQGDLARAQANLEAWFDSSMDRVSGWYKRRTQWILLALGFIFTVGMNINTVTIASVLYGNEGLRASVVAQAEAAGKGTSMNSTEASRQLGQLATQSFSIGWEHFQICMDWQGVALFLGMLPGWLLTAFAISFGAPFWFDMLNKLITIRSTVKPHEKSPEKSSTEAKGPGGQGKVWQLSDGHRMAPAPVVSNAVGAPPVFVAHEWANNPQQPQEGTL